MQRKNSILNSSQAKARNGMAMIMAIVFIVVIATIGALSLQLTTQTTKTTTDAYLYEQAALYAKSATERALLEIAKKGCRNEYNITLGDSGEIQYDANITMQYVYTNAVHEDNNSSKPNCNEYISYIDTPEENGSVLMDTTITLHDPSITTEPIRYFRRTLQKL